VCPAASPELREQIYQEKLGPLTNQGCD
jgi:hypothetical protein